MNLTRWMISLHTTNSKQTPNLVLCSSRDAVSDNPDYYYYYHCIISQHSSHSRTANGYISSLCQRRHYLLD